MKEATQVLPASGPKREALREKGQFWTPDWVANAMAAYLIAGRPEHVYDPAIGSGVLFRAVKRCSRAAGIPVKLLGMELHGTACAEARENGLNATDLAGVGYGDFIFGEERGPFQAIIANPPYIRHHRFGISRKEHLRALVRELTGLTLDGRAGLHVYFLIRALNLLTPSGRLAFLVPADICEGVFSGKLWRWILGRFRLDAVVTFAPESSPFPNVDVNSLVLYLSNSAPHDSFIWAEYQGAPEEQNRLCAWVQAGFPEVNDSALKSGRRKVTEALATGLSRPANYGVRGDRQLLDYATVMRGIATGDNDFFFLTRSRAAELGLPADVLIPALGRTRDVVGDVVNAERLRELDAQGRPTLLFAPDGRPLSRYSQPIRDYLQHGEMIGINKKVLIATRRPWYKMEQRAVPPFLFAYLGRREARFIRNEAGVLPLTGFLCVYPRWNGQEFIEGFWRVLNDPRTVSCLRLVGKSYGSGAIKVEPRGLERLRIPRDVLVDNNFGSWPTPVIPGTFEFR